MYVSNHVLLYTCIYVTLKNLKSKHIQTCMYIYMCTHISFVCWLRHVVRRLLYIDTYAFDIHMFLAQWLSNFVHCVVPNQEASLFNACQDRLFPRCIQGPKTAFVLFPCPLLAPRQNQITFDSSLYCDIFQHFWAKDSQVYAHHEHQCERFPCFQMLWGKDHEVGCAHHNLFELKIRHIVSHQQNQCPRTGNIRVAPVSF